MIIAKGAHTPLCNPDGLTAQFLQQLEWLGSSYADIMMHRDNLDIPVRTFIDVLNEHVRAGRIKAFGGSNWGLKRVKQANSYAQRTASRGFRSCSITWRWRRW